MSKVVLPCIIADGVACSEDSKQQLTTEVLLLLFDMEAMCILSRSIVALPISLPNRVGI